MSYLVKLGATVDKNDIAVKSYVIIKKNRHRTCDFLCNIFVTDK